MKFSYLIALIAITTMGMNAMAIDGTLRRQVAQNDDASSGVVILNTNTATNTNGNNSATAAQSSDQSQRSEQAQAQKAVAQPTTIVEATPVSESRAEALRKARVGAEVETEQKIVEKLEDSRLQEEKARADRLFGNKLDSQPVVAPVQVQQQQQQQTQTTTTTTVVSPAPVPVETKATNVTIEKVEIIQPKEDKKIEEPKIIKIEPVAPPIIVKTEAAPEREAKKASFYVGGGVGNLNYNANNVKSNYGLGVTVGTILDDRFAVELGYFYSNHYINTYWNAPLYNQLDQHDISASAKYLLLSGNLRPYVGASLTYISRTYTDRVRSGSYYTVNQADSESTNAVNMGLLGGVEFQLSNNFMLGAGLEYNMNVFNTSEPDWVSSYNLPPGTTPLEKISYSALKISAKFIF